MLIFAKIVTLAGREIPVSFWTLPAYLWQDLLLVLLFGAIDGLVRRPKLAWACYALVVGYTAINVPIIRVLSTAMTWPMLHATSGTLSDSVAHHLTWLNVVLLFSVIAVGVALPVLCRRFNRQHLRVAGIAALPLIPFGAWAVTRVDTRGLHRNPLFALVTTAVPRVSPQPAEENWRRSPFPQSAGKSLAEFRGVAADHNVVLVVLESAGAQYLRPYGASEDPMPNLTKLARRAILFENAYTSYPESIKGLVAVLSSISPALDTTAEQYETIGTRSLAAVLQRSKYRTGLFHSGRFMYLGMESVIRNRGYDTLEDAGDISGVHNSSFGVDEPSTVRRMLSWIDARPAGSRFFVTYIPIAGHHPYDTPEPGPFPEEQEIDRYRNALHYSDAAIGTLVAGLKRRGLDSNTLLVIVGDHGQAFGQHAGNYGHTFFVFEENVRIPLMFVLPEIKGPVRVRRVAGAIDVAPTILDLLGKKPPAEFRGRSLLEPEQRMALFFTDYSLAILGLRDGRWKFIYELESGRSKLFDLNADPGETRNLAENHPKRVAIYRDRLRRWCAAQRANVVDRP